MNGSGYHQQQQQQFNVPPPDFNNQSGGNWNRGGNGKRLQNRTRRRPTPDLKS